MHNDMHKENRIFPLLSGASTHILKSKPKKFVSFAKLNLNLFGCVVILKRLKMTDTAYSGGLDFYLSAPAMTNCENKLPASLRLLGLSLSHKFSFILLKNNVIT